MKKKFTPKIPRSKVVPPSERAEMDQLVAYYLSSVGNSMTMVTQLTFFNVTNYWHMTDVHDPEASTQKNHKLLREITQKLNKYCKDNGKPLSLLPLPDQPGVELNGETVVVIPWEFLNTTESRQAVDALFEMVSANGNTDLVADADLRDKYVFRAPTDV
ncbi:hypothetical protein JA13_309 [Dickeya phage vB_DsoM_JA13]|uniref:Uncharacterized protein n=1 Tax=Dickeya phage vB_DsoM_JA13 TaxID=2283030 RepID=A0A384ZWU1_9CAUD|nr:hypothetical protein JA13_309 [Dickeya phage vB_DsoM_JA13]